MVEHTRTLDFKVAYALGLGTMIAAGIFSLSGTAVLRIGSTAVIAFVLAAIVAGITAASYSEFASIYSENGGGYLFTSRTFEGQDFLKYGIGMALFLGYTGTTAFYLATMDEWFFEFIVAGTVLEALPHGTYGVLAALLLGVLNARGTEESGTFQLIVTGAKVAVLLAFIAGMFVAVGPAPATGEFLGRFRPLPIETVSVAALAFITFFGFSAIAASAGEIIEPRRTVPRAIAASIGTVTVLYALVIVAMVNVYNVAELLPDAPEAVLQAGETAMGEVAQAYIPVVIDVFGANLAVGRALIVAGAVFSMVSASNASILAASGIGSLMGRQGHAPRTFSRIHPDYGTPFWSVSTATATIVGLIVVFMAVFPDEGGVGGLVEETLPELVLSVPALGSVELLPGIFFLGLEPLTGFATFNLLVPLAIVNAALIYHRRNFPDVERGFRVPGVPFVPVVGILANLALVFNLPVKGILFGILLVLALLVAYRVWGGAPAIEEMYQRVVEPTARGDLGPPVEPTPGEPTPQGEAAEVEEATGPEVEEDRYRILVPVARPSRAARYVRLAALVGRAHGADPLVQVVNVTEIPDQTPYELVAETANERADRIEEHLDAADLDVEYTIEGHISRDVAFDVVHTARDDEVDLILMGYPHEHPEVAEGIEYKSPVDVMYADGFDDEPSLDVINVGVGGGPHHSALLPLVDGLGRGGAEVHLISVDPTEEPKREGEDPDETLTELSDAASVQVHNVTAATVPEGLVSTAAENGGVLLMGASRDRRLRQWVFGATPDRVIDLAEAENVPVIVYASATDVPSRLEGYVFPVYKYLFRRLFSPSRSRPEGSGESETPASD